MNAIGDGIDCVFGKQVLGNFAVFHRYAVDVVTERQSQIRHVQLASMTDGVRDSTFLPVAQHLGHQLQIESIMPRGNRRVRGKHAFSPHRVQVLFKNFVSRRTLAFFA